MKGLWLLGLVCVLVSSCAPVKDDSGAIEPVERPTLSLKDAVYRYESKDLGAVTIQAGAIDLDEKAHKASLKDVTFSQEGDDAVKGKAERLIIDTESQDVVMEGAVEINQPSSGFALEGNGVTWNNGQGVLACPEGEVTVALGSGTQVTGSGFRGDLRRKSWEFVRITQGEIVPQ